MSFLENYLKSKKVQKVLSTKPGEEGFSLIELVVVIAVLAILSAVAIPAFTNVQANARAAAVQNGLVNGLKECAVRDAENESDLTFSSAASFNDVNAFRGFELQALTGTNRGNDSCFAAEAIDTSGGSNTNFSIYIDATTGVAVKACDDATLPGCKELDDGTLTWN